MTFNFCNAYYKDNRGRDCWCTKRAYHHLGDSPTNHYDDNLRVSWKATK